MAKDKRLPDGVWFTIGVVIGAALSVAFVALVTSLSPLVAVAVVVLGSLLFGGLAVAIREEILLMFLP